MRVRWPNTRSFPFDVPGYLDTRCSPAAAVLWPRKRVVSTQFRAFLCVPTPIRQATWRRDAVLPENCIDTPRIAVQ